MLTAAAGSRRTSSHRPVRSAARECASSAMREASSPVTNIPLPSLQSCVRPERPLPAPRQTPPPRPRTNGAPPPTAPDGTSSANKCSRQSPDSLSPWPQAPPNRAGAYGQADRKEAVLTAPSSISPEGGSESPPASSSRITSCSKTIHPVTGLRPLAGIPHLLHFPFSSAVPATPDTSITPAARSRTLAACASKAFNGITLGQIRSHMQHSKILYSYSHL